MLLSRNSQRLSKEFLTEPFSHLVFENTERQDGNSHGDEPLNPEAKAIVQEVTITSWCFRATAFTET